MLLGTINLNIVSGVRESGQIFIDGQFDGISERCMLDTGANLSSVRNTIHFITYEVVGKVTSKGSSGIPKENDLISIHQLALGTYILNEIEVRRYNDLNREWSVIGIEHFHNSVLHFNFLNNTLYVSNEIDSHYWSKVTAYKQGLFSVPVEFGNSSLLGLWDTGAGLTCIEQEFINESPDNFEFIQDRVSSDANGHPVHMKLYKAKSLSIGDKTFSNINVLGKDFSIIHNFIDLQVRVIVGFNIIIQANWSFDLINNKWRIE